MKLPSMPSNLMPSLGEDEIILDLKHEEEKKDLKESARWKNINIVDQVNQWLIVNSKITLNDKLLFFELLVSLLHAGIPVGEALRLLQKQTKNEHMKLIIKELADAIERGMSLAEAFQGQEEVFDEATCSIVQAGEKSGKLNEVMKELVTQYTRISRIQKKVKSVMTYPTIVVIVMILAVVAVLLFVVPQLMNIFGSAESLPIPTQILVNGSNGLRTHWLGISAVIAGLGMLFAYWRTTTIGKMQWTQILLSTPIVGGFIKKMVLSRVMRIFSFLISSGVPIIEGLRISSRVAGNVVYEKKLLLAADDLTRGIEISENFSDDEKLFPQMLVSMIAIGERTASLGSVLEKVSDFYDEELDRSIGTLSKMMEPIIMVIMAIGVVFLLMAIYMPILQMNDQILG